MITKIDSGAIPSGDGGSKSSGGGNTLLYVALLGIALYAGYVFLIKPKEDDNKK